MLQNNLEGTLEVFDIYLENTETLRNTIYIVFFAMGKYCIKLILKNICKSFVIVSLLIYTSLQNIFKLTVKTIR